MKTMLTILLLTAFCGAAHAGIQWTWVNAGTGTEQGTLITDGHLVANEAPAGTYTVVDFSVTASAYGIPLGSVSSGEYIINQPVVGFDWDGAAPMFFWRHSGLYDNGFEFHMADPVPLDPDRIAFDMDRFTIDYDEDVVTIEEYLTPILTPVGSVTTQERSSFGAVKRLYR